ncbi:hypothetical protein DFH09DRAFT_1139287 [Mycena vulgaris]|nr:hypothetical protein DFH09DRAFT_1139287 [Mycena vulgaris]
MADLPLTDVPPTYPPPESLTVESHPVPNIYIACTTILIYDWMCTLDQEVSYVWSSSWTTGKLLFIINRYLPFFGVSVSVAAQSTLIPPAECLMRYKLVSWLTLFSVHLSEVILMLRTYAIWERRRGVLVSLIILFLGTAIPAAVFWQFELNSMEFGKQLSSDGMGCSNVHASEFTIWAYLMVAISETAIAILTAIRAYRDLRWSHQPWIVQLYQDGMLFYVYLLAISLANMLLPILTRHVSRGPTDYSCRCIPPSAQLVLHSVLCTRVLLFLRRQLVRGNTQDSLSSGVNHSRFVFALGSRRDEQSGDIQ